MAIDFRAFQTQFTAHIRSPRQHLMPAGIEKRRMKIYQQLLLNNIEDVLANCFPVLKSILKKRRWQRLVQQFFADHACKTPFYRQIPDELIDYLANERKPQSDDPPFLMALAHYEWIELVLLISDQTLDFEIGPPQDWLREVPVLNPVSALLHYAYPVHQISPQFQPLEPHPEGFYYLVFRNFEDDVEFIVLNPMTALLVQQIQAGEQTLQAILHKIAQQLGHHQPQQVMEAGLEIVRDLAKRGAVMGVKK